MAKINNYDFQIGASFRVFLKSPLGGYATPSKALEITHSKGNVKTDGVGVKINVLPTSGEKTFMDSVEKFTHMVPGKVEITSMINVEDSPTLHQEIDYNAYTGNKQEYKISRNGAGDGDVVIDWTQDIDPLETTHFEACVWLSKTLDHYLGLPSLLWDTDHSRRKVFGQAGTFIPTSTGMKYRVLSNVWVKKPQYCCLVYNNTLEAIKQLFNNEKSFEKDYFGNSVRNIIDNNLREEVSKIMEYSDIKSPIFYREKLGISKENT